MAILRDGFNTTITLAGGGVTFIEKEITPPGMDGGGEIDITAMRNVRWRTRTPKALITFTKMDVKARYDPIIYSSILANINLNQLLGVFFPTLTNTPARKLSFWGWLNKFMPETLKEGEDPLSDMEFFPSNTNNSGVEVAPSIA